MLSVCPYRHCHYEEQQACGAHKVIGSFACGQQIKQERLQLLAAHITSTAPGGACLPRQQAVLALSARRHHQTELASMNNCAL